MDDRTFQWLLGPLRADYGRVVWLWHQARKGDALAAQALKTLGALDPSFALVIAYIEGQARRAETARTLAGPRKTERLEVKSAPKKRKGAPVSVNGGAARSSWSRLATGSSWHQVSGGLPTLGKRR